MSDEQLSIPGVPAPLVLCGPVKLEMSWRFDPGLQAYTTGWRISELETDRLVEWGDARDTWARGMEFAEAGMVVHRLRDTRSKLPPF